MDKVGVYIAAGQFYNVKMFGSISGQRAINEFWFLQTAGTGGSNELQTEFLDSVQDNLPDLLSTFYSLDEIKVYNHNSATDFTEEPIDGFNGTVTGDCLPPYAAFSFKCARARTDIRAGFKRFAGVPESSQGQGQLTSTVLDGKAQDVVAFLNHTFTGGDGSSWRQIIVHRVKTIVGGKPVYKVPVTIPAGGYYIADQWSVVAAVSSQTTRKYGRGS